MRFVIGTRESELAMIQTNHVRELLQRSFPDYEFQILPMTTTGDRVLDQPLSKIGEKALFTKDLENAMLNKECDFIVHSLKDLPTTLPKGMIIGAITKRHSPIDCVVMKSGSPLSKLSQLSPGSKIGTSSVRRRAQLQKLFPHLNFVDIRGNLNTRLRKLDTLDYDAIVLAVAGIERLGKSERITERLEILHAVGQGALGIECMENDDRVHNILSVLNDVETCLKCVAERSFMKTLEGGCSVPLGVSSLLENGILTLTGNVTSIDGSEQMQATETASVNTDITLARDLGVKVAENLIQQGCVRILETIQANKQIST